MAHIPTPTPTGLGWHVGLSIALMTATVGGMAWLVPKAFDALADNHEYAALLRAIASCLALVSLIIGGKAIQAASRFNGSTSINESAHWLGKTKARFSYQALVLIFAVLFGVLVEISLALEWIASGRTN